MSTLEREEPKFLHVTTINPLSNGDWELSCLCGKDFKPFATQKLAKLVENRHKIIVGDIDLDST